MRVKLLSFILLAGISLSIVLNIDQFNYSVDQCKPDMSDQALAKSRHITIETLSKLRANRGLINDEVCSFSDTKLAKAITKANKAKPDHPDEAIAFRNLQLQDENKFIPADGLSKAATHVKAMRAFKAKTNLIKPNVAGIDSGSWTSIGPGNIGGRVRALVIHPTTPDTMWLGSVGGGIWKTTNGGTSWTPLDDFMTNLAVSTLIIDPTDPDILYAGTGEGFFNADGIRGAGIYKTIDGGANWSQLANTANSNFYYVNRLAISPDSSTILAATRTGIWRSLNGGSTWTEESTLNNFLDVNFNPGDSNLAIASGYNGLAYYSTNGGNTWTQSSGIPKTDNGFQRIEVAYAASAPAVVYASEYRVDSTLPTVSQIWKSIDGGQTYVNTNSTGTFLGGQGWYDNIIWVDPTDPTTIIVGGIDLWRNNNNGTAPLTKISQWFSAPNSAHADHHNIVAHPDFDGITNKTVFFTNDGGIYKTSDVYTVGPTSGWTELNNNLAITQFYGAAGHAGSSRVVGGTQDNGTLYYTGDAEAWTAPFGGDGGWSAYDPVDQNYFYGEYVYLQIHRNSSGGMFSSSYIYSGISDAGSGSTSNFISPFVLDPNNANTMLAGGISLWRSTSVKSSPNWAAIKSPVTGNSKISAIAAAPGNSDIIWVGHNDGFIYKTINGTISSPDWNRFDNTAPTLPSRYVTRITIDPNDNEIVYVTFGGFSADNVWRTINGGTNWTDVTGSGMTGLPNVPVRSLVINSTNSNLLYAGTEVGVFASNDSGATWSPSNDGPANVSVDELFWMGSNLVAATHGRGLFTTTPAVPPSTAINPAPANNAIHQLLNSTLSWADGGGALSYDVYFGTVTPPTVTEFKGNQAGTTFDPSALSIDTTYYWRIDSVNTEGTTTGVIWSFNTNNVAPTKPLLVSPTDAATAVNKDLVTFTWQPATDADGDTVTYSLKYCPDINLVMGCVIRIAANKKNEIMFAGLGGLGISILVFGFAGLRNRKNIHLQILAIVCLAIVLGSCSGSSSSDPAPGGGGNTDIKVDEGPLATAETYYWQVTASDGKGGVTDSDIWSFTTN